MRKRIKKQKQDKQTQKPAVQQALDVKAMEPDNDDSPLDFGGLPTRDLKKNLGCG